MGKIHLIQPHSYRLVTRINMQNHAKGRKRCILAQNLTDQEPIYKLIWIRVPNAAITLGSFGIASHLR